MGTDDAMTIVTTPPPRGRDTGWHAMPADEVLSGLDTDAGRGLASRSLDERRRLHGRNLVPPAPRRPPWLRFLLQFHNPLIYVLLGAGAITAVLGDYVDAGVILGVVVINAAIGHVQEGKAERALEAVAAMLAARATVVRDGERQVIDAQDLVPGDIVVIEAGDKVPADLRLLTAKNLRVVEAALTGESAPVSKDAAAVAADAAVADRTSMVYSGTLAAYGQGQGVVVATGVHTEIGRIGLMVGELQTLATPLTRRLDGFARQITGIILVVSALTLGYGYVRGDQSMLDLFLAVVGVAVAAIPEGMPAVVTIVLAIGTRAMASRKAIVRRLPAVETLGSVTVICTDKTGTLTRNEMSTVRLILADGEISVTGTGYVPEGRFHRDGTAHHDASDPAIQAIARCALLCNDARLTKQEDGSWTMVGDPTEGALVTLALKAGLEPLTTERRYPRLDAIPFESERQYMATLHQSPESQGLVLLKGAPERILDLCATQTGGAPLDRAHWLQGVERAAGAGERVLALAQGVLPAGRTTLAATDLTPRFELLGLVGIIDPPRDEAIAAVAECQRAGIQVKMITGDHAITAAAIGRQLGLAADRPLTGATIEDLDEQALMAHALATDVVARATPEHKLRLVTALKAHGHLVAMTGDGVNDAPALKSADIGVAMGHKGTDAAREASDLVLTDDNFATIAGAVHQGRVVFDNITKALMHMLPTNGGEAVVILLAIFSGLPLPVTPGQILWVNTVTSVTLALSLAFEPAEPDVMTQRPRPADEPLVTRGQAMRIAFVILLMVATTFGVFHWLLGQGAEVAKARTAAVNMIVVAELFYLFNVRHFTAHAFRRETLTGNPAAVGVGAVLIALQLMFTYAPPLQDLFGSVALDLTTWGVILGGGLLLFVAVEIEKALLRRSQRHRL